MRRVALACLATVWLLAGSSAARADVIRFEGVATIELYEILQHGNYYDIGTTVVDIDIEMHGPQTTSSWATAAGSAKITRADDSEETVVLQGVMEPPGGSGGFLGASGVGGDGNLYCFRIYDQVDAPSPRPDRLIAAFEPLMRVAQGHVADVVTGLTHYPPYLPLVPLDHCVPLDYAVPIAGDFWFTSIL